MINLEGKIALITGGSRGIGKATALLFAEAGANIIIMFKKNKNDAQRIVNNILSMGRKCFAFCGSVENIHDCYYVVEQAKKKFGKIDILVTAAGIWEKGPINTITPKEWKKTIDINLTGTFNICRAVIPLMKKQKYGKVITISSTAGQRGEPHFSHYAASKGGIIAFTKSLAIEVIKYGIWVNCVAPGWVDTDMIKVEINSSADRKKIIKTIPRGVIATPNDIAGPILFLASHLADHIVGEVINVNGGSVLCG